jgi:hypothetical protein
VALTSFDDDEVDEARDVASIRESANYNQVGYFCASKARLHLCAEEPAEALRHAQAGEPLRASFQGQVADWELTFLRGLAAFARAHELRGTPQGELRRSGQEALTALRGYAKANPHTFAHKARLLEAELAALDGSHDEAASAFREAADLAAASGFTQDRALALHRLAVAQRRSRRDADARAAARSASETYRAWGAHAAADFLLDRYDLRSGAASTS